MLGRIDPTQKEVTVVGAGIAGLLAAYELDRKGYEVSLFEASARVGGLLETTAHPCGLVEGAAHSFLATEPVRELCEELGVQLLSVNPDSRARFILRNGKPRRFPLTVWEVLCTLARAFFCRATAEIQTMEDWGQHFLGNAATRYLIAPMISGIYGVKPSDLTVNAAFPKFKVTPGRTLVGSLLLRKASKKDRGKMVAPARGMQSIVEALEQRLSARLGDRFKKGQKISALPSTSGNIVLSLPTLEAAKLLKESDPELSAALARVEYTSLTSVTAFAEVADLKTQPRGVGVLSSTPDSMQALGILFNSSSFQGRVTDPRLISLTLISAGLPSELESQTRKDLEQIFGLAKGAKLEIVSHPYARAIPRYDAILEKAWSLAANGWCSRPGHLLFGNYSGQVSLRGMIESARKIASQ
jgi:oxygen-dependent protoporphyrinogen oxidase